MCQTQPMQTKDGKPVRILPLVRFWGNLFNTLPKLFIPGTNFSIGFTIFSSLFFSLCRITYDYIYIALLRFPNGHPKTKFMCACTASMTHSLLLVPALWQVLHSQPYRPCAKLDGTPQYYQDAVVAMLQLCSGYMLYDFVFMLRDNSWSLHPDDVPFVGHHIVTLVYMSQVRILRAGHISAMTMMFSGEFTNPWQSAHSVTRFAIQFADSGRFWHIVHPYVEYSFAFLYAFFRSIVGPLQVIHIAYDLILTKEGRKNVAIYNSIVWVVMLSAIIIGSIPWTIECAEMFKDGIHVVKYNETYDHGPRFEL
ncbi:hypothetical protein ACHAW6_011849 [Cyclotella cf. meneghiniana]